MTRALIAARPQATLYREDGPEGPVLLKVLSADATEEEAAKLENELRISEHFDTPSLRRALRMTHLDGRPALVLAFTPGETPTPRAAASLEDVRETLALGVALARALSELHARRIVHRDVKPSNVVHDRETGRVVVIDFGLAARLHPSVDALPVSSRLEGTLAYLPPEQTGRVGRGVDARADLYAFGATLYELLAGHPPFVGDDAAEMVHSHLARTPLRLDRENPVVPDVVAEIVARLLAKSPEDRYQTASAVAADLDRCASELRQSGTVQPFPLGAEEQIGRFALPDRLYGRDREVTALQTAFDRVVEGGRGLVLLEGGPGVGKTALARSLHAAVCAQGGHFVQGAFDPASQELPYHALRSAFGALVDSVLEAGDEELAATRAELAQQLGAVTGALSPIVPGLDGLVEVTEPPELGAEEARNRILYVARVFVRVLTAARPVVVFLDDLQWADAASIDLIDSLLTDALDGRLLIVSTLRDGSTSPALREHLDALVAAEVPVERLSIGPVDEAALRALVADTLRASPDEAAPLATAVHARTKGNIFFARILLAAMHARGGLVWDATGGRWSFHADALRDVESERDASAILDAQLAALPPETRSVLAFAAMIGLEADLLTLATVADASVLEVRAWLAPAIEAELVTPLGRPEAWTDEQLDDDLAASSYARFNHAYVRDAAYARGDAERRPALLLRVGLLLAADPERRRGRLHEIAGLLVRGATAVPDERRREVASILTDAATQALSTGAHEYAASLFKNALGLLRSASEAHPDAADRELMLTATIGCAEAEYLAGELEAADSIAKDALALARTAADRLVPTETRILVAIARNDMQRAIAIGREALAALGIFIPEEPPLRRVVTGLIGLRLKLLGKTPERLDSLPEMTDEDSKVAIRIAQRTAPAAFRAGSRTFPLFVFCMVDLSLTRGNCSVSAFAWSGYAITLSGVLGAYDDGFAFGQLGLRLAARFADPRQTPGVLFVWSNFLRHWKEPLSRSLETLAEASRIGFESGDQFSAVWAAVYRIVWMHALGTPLAQVEAELEQTAEVCRRDRGAATIHSILRQVVDCFGGRTEEPQRLHGEHVDEAALTAQMGTDSEATQVFIFHYYRLVLALAFGSPEQAVREAELAEEKLEAVTGLPWVRYFTFHATLARLAVTRPGQPVDRRVPQGIARYRKWAKHEPHGKGDRLLVLEAEHARVRGNADLARRLFDQAIEAAHAAEHRDVVATAFELAAAHLDATGAKAAAITYRDRAARAYRELGVFAKADRLSPRPKAVTFDRLRHSSSPSDTSIDVATVLKASAALSAEIVVEKLLSRMLSILVENGGAERGALVLMEDGELFVEAERLPGGDVQVGPRIRLGQATSVAITLVRRVARTGAPVVIADAQAEPSLLASPHVASDGVRSILCAPIKHQGKIAGVLYLENNAVRAAFTPGRVQLLSLLATQAAIALDNARLYERQVSLTQAQFRFVPHEFLNSLGRRSIVEVSLGDSVQKEMTTVFSDIRKFTTHVEGMTPDENIAFINQYLEAMEPAILSSGGFVDNYIGDAILALFERPTAGIEGAIAMLRALGPLNETRARTGRRPIAIGIGINSGTLTMGTIGGPQRIRCSVIGDSVNVAARVESLTKHYGASLLVTGDTLERAGAQRRFHARHVDTVRVVGRVSPVALYEVYDTDAPAVIEAKDAAAPLWHEGMQLYRSGRFAAAAVQFAEYERLVPRDPPAALLRSRCATHALSAPASWDGVTTLDTK